MNLSQLFTLSKEQLIALNPSDVSFHLDTEAIIYMANKLGAFWGYNYEAAKNGQVGMHALLKSGRHSDGFFISRIMLQHKNIRKIMANQMAGRVLTALHPHALPDRIAGIPDGATELGEDFAATLQAKPLKFKKADGKISLIDDFESNETLLLCEDFCTRGTGFREAILDIASKKPSVKFIYYEPVIINRGGLKYIEVEDIGEFRIIPIADYRIQDWVAEECPLCKLGSVPIKPKATDENWELITNSQL